MSSRKTRESIKLTLVTTFFMLKLMFFVYIYYQARSLDKSYFPANCTVIAKFINESLCGAWTKSICKLSCLFKSFFLRKRLLVSFISLNFILIKTYYLLSVSYRCSQETTIVKYHSIDQGDQENIISANKYEKEKVRQMQVCLQKKNNHLLITVTLLIVCFVSSDRSTFALLLHSMEAWIFTMDKVNVKRTASTFHLFDYILDIFICLVYMLLLLRISFK